MKKDKDVLSSANEKEEQLVLMKKKVTNLKLETVERVDAANFKQKEEEDVRIKVELRVSELEKQLSAREPVKKVISDFKKSNAYRAALAEAAASKIERYWLVAEKHIKTNSTADWDTFCDQYIAVEDTVAKGGPEPEPYDGPTLAFLPDVTPDQDPLLDLFL